jgi:hypothetical protein
MIARPKTGSRYDPAVTDPAYLAGLEQRSTDDVRAMRAECQALEAEVSYVRRLVQGRLDIVDAELQRRREGRPPSDLATMVESLPDTLARHLTAPGSGRRPTTIEPVDPDPALTAPLDLVLDAEAMGSLPDRPDEDLDEIRAGLEGIEHDLSGRRKVLFERLDALAAEITRRYRDGEASVESLLE